MKGKGKRERREKGVRRHGEKYSLPCPLRGEKGETSLNKRGGGGRGKANKIKPKKIKAEIKIKVITHKY